MAVSTMMAVLWVVAPCSLVEVYQRFRGPSYLHHQGEETAILIRLLFPILFASFLDWVFGSFFLDRLLRVICFFMRFFGWCFWSVLFLVLWMGFFILFLG
jgi:hypothetical protein